MPEETHEEKNIYELFKEISWAQEFLVDEINKNIKDSEGEVIFVTNQNTSILKFRTYNLDDREVVVRSCVEELEFDNDIKPQEIIEFWSGGRTGGGYSISYNYPVFQKILKIRDRGVNKIRVSKHFSKIQKRKNILSLPLEKYLAVKETANKIESQAKSSKDSLQRYLINNAIFDYLNIKVRPTTTVSRGDFEFYVDRFNLQSKKRKLDFEEFLSRNDIDALGEMLMSMIKKEVFPKDYLKKLDAYFIKENLERIIELGREIISLKSDDIKTKKAKSIAKKIGNGEEIHQMETLWQKYFEDYLLYLIFSYKKIIPKVELKDFQNIDNKPDFVGINHYGGVDVLEIKTHLKDVLVWDKSHKNFAFSSEMSKSIIQTINYMEGVSRLNFKYPKDERDLIKESIEKENLYHPRGIIIISSKNKIFKGTKEIDNERLQRDFTKLRNSIQNIQILTFDEILDMAERYSENIAKEYEK
jgi:hypothetical protein